MSASKKACKGTLRQVFFCLRPRTPYSPPINTVNVYTVYLFTLRREEGELNREKVEKVRGAIVHKAARKYQHD